MGRYSFWSRLGRGPVKRFSVLLLALLTLVACGKSSTDNTATSPVGNTPQLAASTSNQSGSASMSLEPASGYGGLYVKVSGTKWPQNMMVLVTIEDAQGRSNTLAASDTDPTGNLTTGFLFPIDQRWLASKSLSVVATTADGQMESKATFTLIPPGTEVAASSPSKTTSYGGETGATVTGTVTSTATLNDQFANTVVLPLVSSAGAEKRNASKNGSNKSQDSAVTQINVDIKPEGASSIDCRRGDRWLSITIHSSNGFDATSVDPGSVTVSDGSSDLGYSGEGATTFVAFHASELPRPAASSNAAYQWRWHLDDVDGDGVSDMVLEYRLDYLKLNCNSATLAVSGHTKDGKNFTGSDKAEKLVVKKS